MFKNVCPKIMRFMRYTEKCCRVRQATDDNTCIIRCIRFACWINKAADTHSEYVIFVVYPQTQQLRECVSSLRYIYIVSLVNFRSSHSSRSNSFRILSAKNKKTATGYDFGLVSRAVTSRILVAEVQVQLWVSRYGIPLVQSDSERFLHSVFPCTYHATISSQPSALHNLFQYVFHLRCSSQCIGGSVF